MNDSSPNQPKTQILSDARMDDLLREFFALETPASLKQGFRRPAQSVVSSVSLSTIPVANEVRSPVRRVRSVIVGSVISVLMLCLLLLVQSPGSEHAGTAPATTRTENDSVSPDADAARESLMLVSPKGDSPSTYGTVSEDGVTLEETETIEVKSRR